MHNANSPEYLNKIKSSVIENLSRTKFGPSVQSTAIPPDIEGLDDEADATLDDMDEDENKDSRNTQRRWDKYVQKDGELSESEDEEENSRNGVLRQPGTKRRRNIMDYQNPNAAPDIPESGAQTPDGFAPSINGDAQAAANGELHADMVHNKAANSASLAPSIQVQPTARASIASHNGDVDMLDRQDATGPTTAAQVPTIPPTAAAAVAQAIAPTLPTVSAQLTPPDSPQPVTAPIQQPAATSVDVAMAEADTAIEDASITKAEGVAERVEADTNAEAATEAVTQKEQ